MLIPLLFVAGERVLEGGWLYVSLYFKRHRSEYYSLLQKVRTHGAWEEWMEFYLIGIAQVADEAVHKIRELLALFERDCGKLESSRGRTTYQRVALQMNLDIYEHLRRKVAIRITETAAAL